VSRFACGSAGGLAGGLVSRLISWVADLLVGRLYGGLRITEIGVHLGSSYTAVN
jgi:hypothetical protein